jgi:hypothetical protein
MNQFADIVALSALACSSPIGQATARVSDSLLPPALASGVKSCLAADDGSRLSTGRLSTLGWKLSSIAGVATASMPPIVMLLTTKKKSASGCMIMQSVSSSEYKQTISAVSQLLAAQPVVVDGIYTWTDRDRRIQMTAVDIDGLTAKIVVGIPWRSK